MLWLALVACTEPRSVPTPDLGLVEPRPAIFLDDLVSSAGGGLDRLLDDDPSTGWTPHGDPAGEFVTATFDPPLPALSIEVTPCEASPEAHLQLELDGVRGPALHLVAGRSSVADLGVGSVHGLSSLRIEVESGSVDPSPCIAEIALTDDLGPIPLRPPRAVTGRIRASSVRAPASMWTVGWAIDGLGDTAFSPGDPDSRLIVTLDDPMKLLALEAWTGLQGESDVGGRPTRLEITVDAADGTSRAPFLAGLADRPGAQRIDLPEPSDVIAVNLRYDQIADGADGPLLTELRLVDDRGPLRLRTRDAAEFEASQAAELQGGPLADHIDRQLHSVCGYPRRTLKLRADALFTRVEPTETSRMRSEGRWAALATDGPWTSLRLRGSQTRDDAHWSRESSVDPLDERLDVAPVALLGEPAFKALIRDLGDAASCLTEELGAWPDAYASLIAGDALVVRGDDMRDLVWPQ